MSEQEIVEKISKNLKEIYAEYSSQGILTMYIWGSILTPDFNPQTSDVDTIAIVDDEMPLEYETRIQKELAGKQPDIKKFGFRIIYKSELDSGIAKGPLGNVITPALLLLDLPTWRWVCGEKFTQKDFELPVPTYEEALALRRARFQKEGWTAVDSVQPEAVQYFVKQILRIIHLNQLRRDKLPYSIFSYSSIKKDETDPSEAEMIDICLKIKALDWNYSEFEKYKNEFENYISK